MNGSYKTKQKSFIEAFMKENTDLQFTCEEISQALKLKETPVGKTTVYRYVEKLAAEGRIRKIQELTSKSVRYQYIDSEMHCHSHMHLKCIKCGEFIHLDCHFMNDVSEHIYEHHKFSIDNSKTILYGLCNKCNV